MRLVRCGLVIYLYIITRVFVIDIYEVKGKSMQRTLFDGDYVLVSKIAYGARLPVSLYEIPVVNLLLYVFPFSLLEVDSQTEYRRLFSSTRIEPGDIVVCNTPIYQQSFAIKRCIAFAGDTLKSLQIGTEILSGVIPFTGMEVPACPVDSLNSITRRAVLFYYDSHVHNNAVSHFIVDRDFVYLLGDNYAGSTDSRSWGPVKADHIVGKVIKIFPQKAEK